MRILSENAVVGLSVLVFGLVLSGCGYSSGMEATKDIGKSLLVDVAADVVADCTDYSQPNNETICRDKEETVVKLGQSLHSVMRPADEGPNATELSEDLNTFIEQRRSPQNDNGDVTDRISSH